MSEQVTLEVLNGKTYTVEVAKEQHRYNDVQLSFGLDGQNLSVLMNLNKMIF